MSMDAGNFSQRLAVVRERIASACARAGRDPEAVTLVAVAKNFGPEAVAEAAGCGLAVFGENRVQEARQKIPLCPGRLEWHLVGHLQRNKVREAVRLFRMIHSIDSASILDAVERVCAEEGCVVRACLEVNVSGEGTKFGFAPDAVPPVLERRDLAHVDLVGLMTIPPLAPESEAARPAFRRLRQLRDEWRASCGVDLPELSMGMSEDFEVAIEEGATLVRIGTLLFGPRQRADRQTDEGAEAGGG